MEWKEVAKSKDLIVFEKDLKNGKLKIEARKVEGFWEVFKTQVRDNYSNLLSEYSLENENQVSKIIEILKSEKDPNPKENAQSLSSSMRVNVKRIYKEDFIEKWMFYMDDKNFRNFLVAKFDNDIKADIVMHEKYRYYESLIISQLEEKLGLRELGESISYEIYYFRRSRSSRKRNTDSYEHDFIDIEFNVPDEEED